MHIPHHDYMKFSVFSTSRSIIGGEPCIDQGFTVAVLSVPYQGRWSMLPFFSFVTWAVFSFPDLLDIPPGPGPWLLRHPRDWVGIWMTRAADLWFQGPLPSAM